MGGLLYTEKPKVIYSPKVSHEIYRLGRKNPQLLEEFLKKVEKLRENPNRGEHLSYGLSNTQSVHIKDYVMIFRGDRNENSIVVERFDKHDKAYGH